MESEYLKKIYDAADGYLFKAVSISSIIDKTQCSDQFITNLLKSLESKAKIIIRGFNHVSLTANGIDRVESKHSDDDLIIKRKEERISFLRKLFDLSNGKTDFTIDFRVVGDKIGLDADKSQSISEYLHQKSLLHLSQYGVSITPQGIAYIS
jgi:hypothetical protein